MDRDGGNPRDLEVMTSLVNHQVKVVTAAFTNLLLEAVEIHEAEKKKASNSKGEESRQQTFNNKVTFIKT